jgi:hypothetical protein
MSGNETCTEKMYSCPDGGNVTMKNNVNLCVNQLYHWFFLSISRTRRKKYSYLFVVLYGPPDGWLHDCAEV